MTPGEVRSFLEVPRTGVLSTLNPDGGPHLSGIWFVMVGDEIHMWTYAKSQKARNAMRDQRVGFLVETGVRYDELQGVMIRGRIEVVEDFDSVARIGRLLYDRYTKPMTGIPLEQGPIEEIERQARKRVGLILPMEKVASWHHGKLDRREGSADQGRQP